MTYEIGKERKVLHIMDGSTKKILTVNGIPRHKDFVAARPVVYADSTIDSMIDPQVYGAGTYPYGHCVTQDDSGTINTYQVNSYTGTDEAPGHADWDNLGEGKSFVPVATHQDLNAVRTSSARTFGDGTKWEDTYTGGLDKLYIQVKDIDLGFETRDPAGAYYNGGEGWEKMGGTFSGIYDGGGCSIIGLYINNTASNNYGLFGTLDGVFKNTIFLNSTVKSTNIQIGTIAGFADGEVENVIIQGLIKGNDRVGSAVGLSGITSFVIKNTLSLCPLVSNNTSSRSGGLIGDNRSNTTVINSCSGGYVLGSGGLVGRSLGIITSSYYNTETSGQTDTGKGVPKTTAELLAGEPSAGIFTDWDTNLWEFQEGKYPIHKFFGELAVNLPPPTNLSADENAGDIDLSWDAPTLTPKGYNAYVYIEYASTDWEDTAYSEGDIVKHEGFYYKANTGTSEEPPHADWDLLEVGWNKINTELITGTTDSYTPPEDGMYNFFVTAVYFNAPYNQDQETGNSVVTTEEIT